VQDEERRRIARELHDTVGQYLAGLRMNLSQLKKVDASKFRKILDECGQVLDQCINETRTLSYLLHPPLLDELGLASIATSYVQEFGRRSGIEVDILFDLPYRLRRRHRNTPVPCATRIADQHSSPCRKQESHNSGGLRGRNSLPRNKALRPRNP
jgi:signal transduction histidine kinase